MLNASHTIAVGLHNILTYPGNAHRSQGMGARPYHHGQDKCRIRVHELMDTKERLNANRLR
jgi:hypothetical protein